MKRILLSASIAGVVLSSTLPAEVFAAGAGQTGNAFNPSIGLILNGTYAELHDPANYTIPGFPLAAESDPGSQGFSIGESELSISANIDPSWYGVFTLSMAGDNTSSVENAFVQSTTLGHGLTFRFGRFFSGVGYLNEQHAHTWDFADTALAYRALLGTQYGDDGVQLRWLAPTDLFIEVGAEGFRGDSFPAGGSANKGRGSWSSFVHIGDDVGISSSWRAGLSYLSTRSVARATGSDKFTGTSNVFIADFVWKWAPNGNAYSKSFKFQGEYLQSQNNGMFTPSGSSATAYSATPNGWYMQAVYKFMPQWRVAVRHDQLNANYSNTAFTGTTLDSQGHQPKRDSIMVDHVFSEFSRLRLQLNHDQSQSQADNQLFLQYTMSLGAHGAHIF